MSAEDKGGTRPVRITASRLRKTLRRVPAVLVFIVTAAGAFACNIPVFRFALERWRQDEVAVTVFHHGQLTAADEEQVNRLRMMSVRAGGTLNMDVRAIDPAEGLSTSDEALYAGVAGELREDSGSVIAVARLKAGRGREVTLHEGLLSSFEPAGLFSSPVRSELKARMLRGDAVVWLLLKGDSDRQTDEVRDRLRATLASLPGQLELPEGIGEPGSELYSEVPLLLQFSVLEVDPDDDREANLVRLLRRLQPAAAERGLPIAAPVFGRGRVLEVIPGDQLSSELIVDLTRFLSGACSCQVKDLNPGFDLPMTADWQTELFGEEEAPPEEQPESLRQRNRTPVLVPIP